MTQFPACVQIACRRPFLERIRPGRSRFWASGRFAPSGRKPASRLAAPAQAPQSRRGRFLGCGFLFPIEVRPNVGTLGVARLTGKPQLKIGQADMIRPSVVRADRCGMATSVVRAIDQEAADARSARVIR
jgi:hypothetical protein